MAEVIVGVVWIVTIGCGALIGQSKGIPGRGVFWTVFLGPIGLLLVLCLPSEKAAKRDDFGDWEKRKALRANRRAGEQNDDTFIPENFR